jgi:hypothetical protein
MQAIPDQRGAAFFYCQFFQERRTQEPMNTKPYIFNDPDELKRKIDAYFKHCEESKKVYDLKNGDIKVRQEYPSMAGLSLWLDVDRKTLYNYMEEEHTPGMDDDCKQKIIHTLSRAREKIKQSLVQASILGDADSRISGMLLTAMGETTPEVQNTVNVIIQGDSDAYSV